MKSKYKLPMPEEVLDNSNGEGIVRRFSGDGEFFLLTEKHGL
jgi:hypothetical protein